MSDHTCNAWCAPPRHAHLVLIDPQCTTEDDVLMHLAAPYAALHGRSILHARLAPEADREAVIQAQVGATGASTRGRYAQLSRERLEGMRVWRITYEDSAHA